MKRARFPERGFLCLLVLCFVAATTCADASVWYVAGDALQSGNGSSWAEAFRTIEEGVSASSSSDELWIKTGTYTISKEILNRQGDCCLWGLHGYGSAKVAARAAILSYRFGRRLNESYSLCGSEHEG